MKLQNTVVRRSVSVCELICLLGLATLAHAHANSLRGVWAGHLSVVGIDRLYAEATLSVTPEKASLELSEGSMHCTLEDGAYKENEQSSGYSILFAASTGGAACQRFVNQNFEFVPGPNRRVWTYSVSYTAHGEEIHASGTLMRAI